MTTEPNIFEFATSELSQDAFLCYLLTFGKSKYKDENNEEYKLAHSILEELGIEEEDIEEIKRQENHIDVLILTKSHAVILEDKTFSKEHSGQLKRYNEICKSKYSDKKVKLLYFKTGYMDIQEKEKFNDEICIFDIEKIMSLIEAYTGNNVIIKMWIENTKKINENIADANEKIQNVEKFDTYYKLSNTDTLQRDVYLDKLTKRFKKDFNDVYWYRAGQGRTPHICFQDIYFKCSCSERCKIHFGIYIMFRNEPQIVVKQHFYTISEKHRLRLREYNKYGEELKSLQEMKYEFQKKIPLNEGWEKKNENKDKLIILEKKISDIEKCIEDIKKLQAIISSIGTPIDNVS